MADKIIRAHIFIEGRVQGIFYRVWILRQAQHIGLTGWVKNLEDGRVEAVFEGPKSKVEKMVKECHKGPRLAGVKHIEVIWEKATGELDTFEIKY
ncbi:MAG: acylphosphatase [Microgenomates group bacterium]